GDAGYGPAGSGAAGANRGRARGAFPYTGTAPRPPGTAAAPTAPPVQVDGHTLEVSSQRKGLFPAAGPTRGDLARHYRDVAAAMLPHVRGRPVTLMRYPRGVDQPGFVQQAAPEDPPDWVRTVVVEKEEGGALTRLTIE